LLKGSACTHVKTAKTALTVSLMALTLTTCSSAAERTLLTQFFAASRLRDLTALHNVATVVFEPETDGIVTSFDLRGIATVQGPDGRPVSKDVTISAPVRLADGRTEVKALVVTMQRERSGNDQHQSDVWMITAIRAVLP
jgi:hypothetical protein